MWPVGAILTQTTPVEYERQVPGLTGVAVAAASGV